MDQIIKDVISGVRMILILFLCGGFLGLGMLKMVDFPLMADSFASWNFPHYSMYLVGAFEIILSILIFYQPSRINALIISILFMIAAFSTHILFNQWNQLYGPILTLTLIVPLLIIELKRKKS